jgi:hypothetical protein
VKENSVGVQWRPILMRGTDRFRYYPETAAPF